jgi:hypothetical protein
MVMVMVMVLMMAYKGSSGGGLPLASANLCGNGDGNGDSDGDADDDGAIHDGIRHVRVPWAGGTTRLGEPISHKCYTNARGMSQEWCRIMFEVCENSGRKVFKWR